MKHKPFFHDQADFQYWGGALHEEQQQNASGGGIQILPEVINDKLETSKEELQRFTASLRHNILEGKVSAERALTAKKLITEALEQVFTDPEVKQHLQAEISKHPKGIAHFNGAEITMQSRRNWVYKECGDKYYNELKEQLAAREKFLQGLKAPLTVVDDQTGEVATIKPPTSSTSEYFMVKIKE